MRRGYIGHLWLIYLVLEGGKGVGRWPQHALEVRGYTLPPTLCTLPYLLLAPRAMVLRWVQLAAATVACSGVTLG